MGAYKDKNGVTRAGAVLKSIGGFFSGIFGKKSTTQTVTDQNGDSVEITTPKDKTTAGKILQSIGNVFSGIFKSSGTSQGSNTTQNQSGSGSSVSDLLVSIGGVVAGWIGAKTATMGVPSTDPAIYEQQKQEVEQKQATIGTGVVVGLVLIIGGVVAWLIFRKKD
ncbi:MULTISPECIES: hypothetical protein [unclassified Arcicella]|uniref:hypothetical protein n=1 Tax=unclassified Arcicella TaxID=2644986 RepID=UPI0028644283|nr:MULTISPECIES: hypothetical protein [unclassified Arcicella]MDR6564962.1 hypothetical protein [Arcicella sp. BE51]MDR6814752.1 hypothetical protein [Arcicella sp. BE140]MDR6826198.1 hypothetical protein [Arcicella sp. BE139]